MTPGQKCVEAIRAYLAENKTEWRKLNGEIVAGIIDNALPPPVTPQKIMRRPTAEWLDELRHDQANEGLDVDRELARCQLWCNEKRKQCTRARFLNWLLRAERVIAPGRVAVSALPELPGWRYFLKAKQAQGVWREPIPATWEDIELDWRKKLHAVKYQVKTINDFATGNPDGFRKHLDELRQQQGDNAA